MQARIVEPLVLQEFRIVYFLGALKGVVCPFHCMLFEKSIFNGVYLKTISTAIFIDFHLLDNRTRSSPGKFCGRKEKLCRSRRRPVREKTSLVFVVNSSTLCGEEIIASNGLLVIRSSVTLPLIILVSF